MGNIREYRQDEGKFNRLTLEIILIAGIALYFFGGIMYGAVKIAFYAIVIIGCGFWLKVALYTHRCYFQLIDDKLVYFEKNKQKSEYDLKEVTVAHERKKGLIMDKYTFEITGNGINDVLDCSHFNSNELYEEIEILQKKGL